MAIVTERNNTADRELDLPLVSIVTPFYNSADTLARCIESVLAQSFHNFEYVLADNKSTDGSGEIARKYAASDARLRYLYFDEHLPQIPNYNRALQNMAPHTHYCKILQADDSISKDCVEQMLQLATRYPSVGIVGAIRSVNDAPDPPNAHLLPEYMPGKDICRSTLRGNIFAFGSPSSVMYRADLVRARPQFFNPKAFFDDTDTAFELLAQSDFAFCQHLLTYTTRDPNSTFGRIASYDISLLYRYMTVQRIGDEFFTPADVGELRARLTREYYETLVTALWRRPDRREYLEFHRSVLRDTANIKLVPSAFARAASRVAIRGLKRRLRL